MSYRAKPNSSYSSQHRGKSGFHGSKKSRNALFESSLIDPRRYEVDNPSGATVGELEDAQGYGKQWLNQHINKPLPLKDIEDRQHELWEQIHAKEVEANQGKISVEEAESFRNATIAEMGKLRVDMSPYIYQTDIGHYGGLFVDVPEEIFNQFKTFWPPGEFPRKVETKDLHETNGPEAIVRLRKLFPNASGKIKQVFFAERSKGQHRIDIAMNLPQERLETNIHWINEEDTIDQILKEAESWLNDYQTDIQEHYGDPDVKDWFFMAVSELKMALNKSGEMKK